MLAAGVLLIAGCGGGGSDSAQGSSSTPSTVSPSDMQNEQVQLPIASTSTSRSREARSTRPTPSSRPRRKEAIVIRVNSDVADELHVHSTPEHSFKIEPGKGEEFQSTADVPGQVAIELHQLQKTIATVQVQP